MENKIIVVTHKQSNNIFSYPYKYITVGKGDFELKDSWSDKSGDNISFKNANYCELTALYWFWKNQIKNYKYVGLIHYRRIFTKNEYFKKPISNSEIELILEKYDIILPKKFKWSRTVAEVYYVIGEGKKSDLENTRSVINRIYPEYLESFDAVIYSKKASYCNMFIMNSDLTDQYCLWLFNILEALEIKTDLSTYTVQEARIYGYLSEILINVWVNHNNLRIKEIPIVNTEMSNIKHIKVKVLNSINMMLFPLKKFIKGFIKHEKI